VASIAALGFSLDVFWAPPDRKNIQSVDARRTPNPYAAHTDTPRRDCRLLPPEKKKNQVLDRATRPAV
jgi:hypothetical protein